MTPASMGGVCVVTARRLCGGRPLAEVAAVAAAAGARAIQLREKDLPGGPLWRLAREVGPAVRRAGALFLVNDRVDVALAAEADGVHLGGAGLPVEAARRLLRPGMLAGASVHGLEEALRAERAGADYLIFGHVFATGSKAGLAPRGVDALEEVCRAVRVPVLAIGGVTPANAARVREAGAAGVAVMSSVMAATDPAAVVRALVAAWEGTGWS